MGYEGELKTTAHSKWLARRVVKETALQATGKFEGIDLPCHEDVLLGRGKTLQDHSGNVTLRNIVAEYLPEYRKAPKKEKGNVAWKVVVAMKVRGGRFLKRAPNGWWVEVSDDTAREKIGMTYRTSRSPNALAMTTSSVQPLPTESDSLYGIEPVLKRPKKQDAEEPGVVDYSSRSSSSCRNFCWGE